MTKKAPLSKNTPLKQFENSYWYASELKAFAKHIGISGYSKLRKDQLEQCIRHYLETGNITLPKAQVVNKSMKSHTIKDCDAAALTMNTVIKNYTSNKQTKQFILQEAKRIEPNLPKKSGVWYWINRWREEQLAKGSISYGDLVHQFIALSMQAERLPRIPSTKFNNFVSDFLAAKQGSRAEALKAWEALKQYDKPKTFEAWSKKRE